MTVIEAFRLTHRVLLLDQIRAVQIYDLLGVYDQSACLVCSDTMHLHLSRASRVPLVALINNGWRGSVAEDANAVIRYQDATPAAVVEAVRKIVDRPKRRDYANEERAPVPFDAAGVTCVIEPNVQTIFAAKPQPMMQDLADALDDPRIFHAVHMHGTAERHRVAQSTWPVLYALGVVPVHTTKYDRDAKTHLKDPRDLPFLKDILSQALAQSTRPDDIILWTNSDIGFAEPEKLVALLRDHVGRHGAASMRRSESNGQDHIGRDLFAFTAGWLQGNWKEFPDYVIGSPIFDLGLVAMIRKQFGLVATTMKNMGTEMTPAEMPRGFALHESHESEWNVSNVDQVPSVRHNRAAFVTWSKKFCPELKFNRSGALL